MLGFKKWGRELTEGAFVVRDSSLRQPPFRMTKKRIVTEAGSRWNVAAGCSRVQQSEQALGIVGHDSVDAKCQHLAHLMLDIHGPYVNFNSKPVRG